MKRIEPPPSTRELLSPDSLINILQDKDLHLQIAVLERDYEYWETFKRKVKTLKYDHNKYTAEQIWAFVKFFSRSKAMTTIRLNELPDFHFFFNTTVKITKFLHRFDMHLGGLLEGQSIIPAEDKGRYLISSIMEEAIASSKLEGAATTREIAKQMLRENRKPATVDEKMILNNYLTIQRVLELKNNKISKELILEIHALISKDTLKSKSDEGRFRQKDNVNVVDNITGEIFYTPPPHDKLEDLMSQFCEFANSESEEEFIHPIVRGIILHFLIGYIHPFVDGNGRTARAVFYWFLIYKGYWLIEYMSISKIIIRAPAQYARAYLYTENDSNDLTYFIDYNLKSMSLALDNLHQYIQRKVVEKQNLFNLIQYENINERQAELLKGLIVDNKKSYTINEVQSRFGIVYETARTDLLKLKELGYLSEKKFGKKLIFFRERDFDKKMEKISKNGT